MVPGRDNCEHYSLLPTPANTGEPGVVSSQECQVLEERGFFNHSFSAMEFQRAQFAPHCFTEVGQCREACQGGSRGAMSRL